MKEDCKKVLEEKLQEKSESLLLILTWNIRSER